MSATRTNKISFGRKAGLFLVGTAGALTLTGGLAGTASALSPMPQPTLPIAQAPQQPEPPAGPMVLTLPEDDGPVVEGPGDLATPTTVPDPHPTPQPQGPGDLTIGEPDDGGGFDGPDDFDSPGPDDGGGGFEGPDDFTIGDPDPVDPVDPVDPIEPVDPVEPVDPEPTPEVLDETVTEDTGSSDTADAVDAPEELAFTGGDINLVAAAAALLTAGGLAAGAAVVARRRNDGETDATEAVHATEAGV